MVAYSEEYIVMNSIEDNFNEYMNSYITNDFIIGINELLHKCLIWKLEGTFSENGLKEVMLNRFSSFYSIGLKPYIYKTTLYYTTKTIMSNDYIDKVLSILFAKWIDENKKLFLDELVCLESFKKPIFELIQTKLSW